LILKHLNLVNFKNIIEASIDLDSDVNCFSGLNGEGKTNILDAIRYLSMCKSYFNPADYQNINHNQDSFMIKGTVLKNNEIDILSCSVSRTSKKIFKRNKKDYQRLSDHIGLYPSD
jgi:DNA replication and repair protein RecF